MVSGVDVRQSKVAGSFYPEDKEELHSLLKNFFGDTYRISPDKKIQALIVPHAGYIYSGQTAAWGFKQLPKQVNRQHFVMIGPSHYYSYNGIAGSSRNFWETPLAKIKHVLPKNINNQIFLDDNPHLSEHCLEVQLPFLQFLYPDNMGINQHFSISCLLTGSLVDINSAADFFLKNYSFSIFIISSDLSHYLPENKAREKDKKTIEAILNLNSDYFLTEENTACGMTGILILIAMVRKRKWKGECIHYATSATVLGDESAVVGYASVGFHK